MIFSNLSTWKDEERIYSKALNKALHYLSDNNFEGFDAGEYEIDGRNIFAIVMDKETEEVHKRAPEVHSKYIDIQLLITGSEKIGFSRINDTLVVKSDMLKEKDLLLYESEIVHESFVCLMPGDFAIFYPSDVHRPLCAYNKNEMVRKVVVKIDVNAE